MKKYKIYNMGDYEINIVIISEHNEHCRAQPREASKQMRKKTPKPKKSLRPSNQCIL